MRTVRVWMVCWRKEVLLEVGVNKFFRARGPAPSI